MQRAPITDRGVIGCFRLRAPTRRQRGGKTKGPPFTSHPNQLNRLKAPRVQTCYLSNYPMGLLDLPNELLLAIILLIGGFDILPSRLVSDSVYFVREWGNQLALGTTYI